MFCTLPRLVCYQWGESENMIHDGECSMASSAGYMLGSGCLISHEVNLEFYAYS
jgi:hypothetical protein